MWTVSMPMLETHFPDFYWIFPLVDILTLPGKPLQELLITYISSLVKNLTLSLINKALEKMIEKY